MAVATPMLRRVLALLLVSPGRGLPADLMIDVLWCGRPPRTARQTLLAYISRLRSTLGSAERISHSPAGFTFHLDPHELDALRFEALIRQLEPCRLREHWRHFAAVAQQALGLWRGEAFAEIADVPLAAARRTELEQARLGTSEKLMRARLELGDHEQAVAGSRAQIAIDPYRENLYATLMLALYRSGRRAEALQAYREMYGLFVRELAVEPMAQIQQLHQRMLRADPSLQASPKSSRRRWLPPAVPEFTGR